MRSTASCVETVSATLGHCVCNRVPAVRETEIMRTRWIVFSVLVLIGLFGAQSTTYGQSDAVAPDLRTRLRARFDVVALQQGVALVPLEPTSNVRMIQIIGGVVTVDGESLT